MKASLSTRNPAARGRVLIVDDDVLVRETMHDYIEHLGYAVRDVEFAEKALAEITREPPDLILLDVRMPGRSGIDLCGQLKSDPVSLMAIVDVYDALCTQRPYKSPFGEVQALKSLHEGAQTGQFDPELARVFLELRQTSTNSVH
jgi:response regulator RpfG family c-di-GMP phosphodiesterase